MFKYFSSKLDSNPKNEVRFFSTSTTVLQCLQLDSQKRSVCIIIFSLCLSYLITYNFKSSQAVNSLVEGFKR